MKLDLNQLRPINFNSKIFKQNKIIAKNVSNGSGNKKVEKCITTKMMGWQFPIPKGQTAVNVNYPFMLRPMGT